ncbi:hypothetical protein [Psychrobacter sp. 16-MNA-CIBAN-0192]|uniref:hypothetical protein n=1 Tax=Psychrobacter sp. 16-MNA-CIBAN-0192 TaxID=3140448 RepID=UPI00332CA9BD
MDNRKIAGSITAVIAIVALVTMLNFGMDTPIISWPLEAYLGVAFSIGWLTSVPTILAYVLGALVFILIALAFYKLGSWVYGLATRLNR